MHNGKIVPAHPLLCTFDFESTEQICAIKVHTGKHLSDEFLILNGLKQGVAYSDYFPSFVFNASLIKSFEIWSG